MIDSVTRLVRRTPRSRLSVHAGRFTDQADQDIRGLETRIEKLYVQLIDILSNTGRSLWQSRQRVSPQHVGPSRRLEACPRTAEGGRRPSIVR